MKRFLLLLTFSMLLYAIQVPADQGTADVVMEGEIYHLTLDSVDIIDGKLTVAIEGFGSTLRWGANGPMVAALPEARYGDEAVKVSTVNMNVGAAFTFIFERNDLPDEIWMNSYDEGVDPVLIWKADEAAGEADVSEAADAAEAAAVPDDLVGDWGGTGIPKGGGPSIDLTAHVEADGSGEYTFVQAGYTESYPFTISSDDSTFSVDIPSDNYLGISSCGGTWTLEDSVLKLDITTVFASGGNYSYTAECRKMSSETPAEDESGVSDAGLSEEAVSTPESPEDLAAESGQPESSDQSISPSIKPGDQLTFGHYDQDADSGNGGEPIAWIVLDVEDGLATMMSRDVLDARAYNGLGMSITWDRCSLRKWLNGSFLDSAFDDAERAVLETVKVTADINPGSPDSDPGTDTEDMVYLLSVVEAEKYFGELHILPAMPTETAIANGVYVSNVSGEEGQSLWWLRSPGHYSDTAAYVVTSNSLQDGGNDVSKTNYGIRPVVKAKLSLLENLSGPVEIIEPEYPEELAEVGAEAADYVEGSAEAFAALSPGDNILFGRYDQDNDPDNGAEGIEWIVLDNKDGMATLMSRYVLDARAFNGLCKYLSWDECSLRRWLNGEFLNGSFTEDERAAIRQTKVTADANPDYPDADNGADTEDMVYLLSIDEAAEYFGDITIEPGKPTRTAVANGAYVSNTVGSIGTTTWWLRTTGGYDNRAVYIHSVNELNSNGDEVGRTDNGIRPVINVDITSLPGLALVKGTGAAVTGSDESVEDASDDGEEYTESESEVPEEQESEPEIMEEQESEHEIMEEQESEPEITEEQESEPEVIEEQEPGAEPAPEEESLEASEDSEKPEQESAPVTTEDVLNALNDDTWRAASEALLAGEVIQKGSLGDTAKGVQETLVAFGQDIAVDGNVGPKTIAALNAVQAAFGMEQTETLDADGYAQLLPGLLMVTNPDEADSLLAGQMEPAEYDYMRACALEAQRKYASAKTMFEDCGWGDWETRAEACVQPWPATGVLYKNPDVSGSSTELTVKFNTDPDTAMLVKIYTLDDRLARTMFIGGTGQATCSLPADTYIVKDGTGKNWYGEVEAFGSEGYYEIMTFGDGGQEVQLLENYSATITVNVQEDNPNAIGVGSNWESWGDF